MHSTQHINLQMDLSCCYLNVFLVGAVTAVCVVLEVVFAEYQGAGVTFHRQEVQLVTRFLIAMLSEIWQLHCITEVNFY